MTEYRTKPLNRQLLLDEVAFISCKLKHNGSTEVAVSFGWDSNLPIDELWKGASVPVEEVLEYVCPAERAGIVVVGEGDIFVESQDFCLTVNRPEFGGGSNS